MSKRGGYVDNVYCVPKYPGYVEPKIDFLPTYKTIERNNDSILAEDSTAGGKDQSAQGELP